METIANYCPSPSPSYYGIKGMSGLPKGLFKRWMCLPSSFRTTTQQRETQSQSPNLKHS